MLIISKSIVNKEIQIWITELTFLKSVDKFSMMGKQSSGNRWVKFDSFVFQ